MRKTINQSITTDPAAIARTVKLRYVKASIPGYTRIKKGRYFQYVDQQGKKITDKDTLERISKLVLPPAWEKVWICPVEMVICKPPE